MGGWVVGGARGQQQQQQQQQQATGLGQRKKKEVTSLLAAVKVVCVCVRKKMAKKKANRKKETKKKKKKKKKKDGGRGQRPSIIIASPLAHHRPIAAPQNPTPSPHHRTSFIFFHHTNPKLGKSSFSLSLSIFRYVPQSVDPLHTPPTPGPWTPWQPFYFFWFLFANILLSKFCWGPVAKKKKKKVLANLGRVALALVPQCNPILEPVPGPPIAASLVLFIPLNSVKKKKTR